MSAKKYFLSNNKKFRTVFDDYFADSPCAFTARIEVVHNVPDSSIANPRLGSTQIKKS